MKKAGEEVEMVGVGIKDHRKHREMDKWVRQSPTGLWTLSIRAPCPCEQPPAPPT